MKYRDKIEDQIPLVFKPGDMILETATLKMPSIVVATDNKILPKGLMAAMEPNSLEVMIPGILWMNNRLPISSIKWEESTDESETPQSGVIETDIYLGNIHENTIPMSYQIKYRQVINFYLKWYNKQNELQE